jgi:aspartyl-tRNA(Asn)/glutamyl-tRNA(Gln) amidotransferase subunit C
MASDITKEDVKRLANLARLGVPEEEMQSVAEDITNILGFVDVVQSVELGGSTSLQEDEVNVFREDTVNPLTSEHDLIEAAPLHQDHFVKVPKVIE